MVLRNFNVYSSADVEKNARFCIAAEDKIESVLQSIPAIFNIYVLRTNSTLCSAQIVEYKSRYKDHIKLHLMESEIYGKK